MDPEPDADAAGVTAGDAARRLGVAVTTLRSWDRRYGLGPRVHEPGRHRRYTRTDLARLEHMRSLVGRGVPASEAARTVLTAAPVPQGSADLPGLPDLPDLARGRQALLRAAGRLDQPAAAELLDRLIALHGVVPTWEEVAGPVLSGVGRRWAEAHGPHAAAGFGCVPAVPAVGLATVPISGHGRFVEVEHMLSYTIGAALHRVRPATPPRRGRGALLACTGSELHTLPLEALAAALAERGVRVRMMGAAVPSRALVQAARRTAPGAVVLWSQAAASAAPATLAALRGLPGAVIHPAGPGWAFTPLPGGTRALESLTQAVALLT